MKKYLFITTIIFIIGIITIILSSQNTQKSVEEKGYDELYKELTIGDVYIDSIFVEDPFRETLYDTVTDLDIKTNYIKYYRSAFTDTTSSRIDYFISRYK